MSIHNPLFPRASGILLHPTSLPGRCGVGNLGAPARRFVDWLADAGQSWWQVLPLGPTTWGDSPYQTLSAFAGNPLLIDPDPLVADGWLTPDDLGASPPFPADHVDFGRVLPFMNELLDRACDRFQVLGTAAQRAEHDAWIRAQTAWLDDWALYAALKEAHDGRPWHAWPAPLARRDPAALAAARAAHAALVARHRFRQWVFHRQWAALRAYAQARGVRLLGDVPIFVAHDSADVWAHRELFQLDAAGQPTVVAGVPPDYFSKTGQRWGNPLYRWDALRARGYDWWIARFRQALALVDAVRIDHFRGFAANWEIPAAEPTAVKGRWVPGPGADLFHAVRDALGALPIVAEDLGVITPDVEALRDELDLPGMKVLQFAWSDPRNPFLPHAHVPNAVVYSRHARQQHHRRLVARRDRRPHARLPRQLPRPHPRRDRPRAALDADAPRHDVPRAHVHRNAAGRFRPRPRGPVQHPRLGRRQLELARPPRTVRRPGRASPGRLDPALSPPRRPADPRRRYRGARMIEIFSRPEAWISLATLAAMEIVLGIDNIVFLTILVGGLPKHQRGRARTLGLALALVSRLLLLLAISWVMTLTTPLFALLGHAFSGRDLILLVGGLFLVAKATHEIHASLEVETAHPDHPRRAARFGLVLAQIAVLDIVFSLDSVVTAVGMARHLSVMVTAMVIAVGVMMVSAASIGRFVERHPSLKILALSFLILIGVTLMADALGQHISKGYIYFAMAFSLGVEMVNMRLGTRKQNPVHLHGPAA